MDEEAEEDLEDEENDMELAWRNLETARLIYSKHPGKEKELADVYAALAELSMERGQHLRLFFSLHPPPPSSP